jgi:hypothetical protein
MCTKGKERRENVSKAFGSMEKARLFLGKKKEKKPCGAQWHIRR